MRYVCCALSVSTLLLGVVAEAQDLERREIVNDPVALSALLVDPHEAWTIRVVEIEALGAFDLDVEDVEVFAQESRLVVNDGTGEGDVLRPPTRFLRGRVRGVAGSLVALTVTADGDISGLMTDGLATWRVGRRATDARLEATVVSADREGPSAPFQCEADSLLDPPELAAMRPFADEPPPAESLPTGQYYRATIAIETDYEFFQLFGSHSAASNYIGSLFNYVSGIYELETQTRLVVGDVFLWATPSDPWVEEVGTTCRLFEFGRYWRDYRSSVYRTLAHFLSGRALGGGVAWLDALCLPTRTLNSSTGCGSVGNDYVWGGFGVSANLTGTYQTPSGIAWDAKVVAHELGHNFNSPHTHCYGGIGGSANPVDACWSQEQGCWSGATSLPGINSLAGGTIGGRNGTIMSYCHRLSGGVSNIAASFGASHEYGVLANRVPTRMFNQVAQVASNNPACIPVTVSLGQALDNTALSWTTGGDAPWFGQTATWFFGGAAAQSGAIGHSQSSWLQTTVSGPGLLSFRWKVSSEWNYDFLSFSINGIVQSGAISGSVDWQSRQFDIQQGTHTLRWTYGKDAIVSAGSDAGWVDQVAYTVDPCTLPPVRVVSVTSTPVSPRSVGTPVTWTAQACGAANLEYKFFLYDVLSGQWSTLRDWGPFGQTTWTPALAGTYRVQVWVRRVGSTAAQEAWLNSSDYTVTGGPARVISVTPSPAGPMPIGSQMTWTASAVGCTSPADIRYRFLLYDVLTQTWTRHDWGVASVWQWTPALAGTYRVQVWARCSGSTAPQDSWLNSTNVTVTGGPARLISVPPAPAGPVAVGMPVTWTASAVGCASQADLRYRFLLYDVLTQAWTRHDWGAASTWHWTPALAGTYRVQVWARCSASTAPQDSWMNSANVTVAGGPARLLSVTPSPAGPVAPGTPVTWTASAVGCTAQSPPHYRFLLYNVGAQQWTTLREYSTLSSAPWTPTQPGTYRVQVWARCQDSSAPWESWQNSPTVAVGSATPSATAAAQ